MRVRDAIEAMYPEDSRDFNGGMKRPGALPRVSAANERRWNAEGGKAEFHMPEVGATGSDDASQRFRLVALRSNDQFNTTISGYRDCFRHIEGARRVVMLRSDDRPRFSMRKSGQIGLATDYDDDIEHGVGDPQVVPCEPPRGCIASCCPECNPLLPVATRDRQPCGRRRVDAGPHRLIDRSGPANATLSAYSTAMADDPHPLIAQLALAPHPEGGHFRRFHASAVQVEWNGLRRPAMTAIHYLLLPGERSRWHRVDSDEAWHWQQGGPLELLQFDAATSGLSRTQLGPADREAQPCCIVPAGVWQAARPLAGHALVACIVSPGFSWQGFEWLPDEGDVTDALRRLRLLPP